MQYVPEHLNKSWDSTRLEYSQQALSVVWQIVQCSRGAASRLHIVGVLHGPDNGGHHLWGAHDSVARSLLLWELVDHHRRFVYNNLPRMESDVRWQAEGEREQHSKHWASSLSGCYLVLVVEELGELWNGSRCQLSVILVVDQIDHGVFQHLWGLRQPLDIGGVGCVELCGGDLHPLLKSLWKHGGANPLCACHGVLTIYV